MLEHPAWQELNTNKYQHRNVLGNPIHAATLHQYNVVRNARINFSIKVEGNFDGFHTALLFRKNGENYIGVGLGGWRSYYSLFHRDQRGLFSRAEVGAENQIRPGSQYQFEVEFRSGTLIYFRKDGETLFERIAFRDALGTFLRNGHLGIYAYNDTVSTLTIESIEVLKPRCFVITNIEGAKGVETTRRRKLFEGLVSKVNADVEFIDSRDLPRELPLMTKIRTEIAQSDFVIADLGLGEPRPNVYYELGIAHSLGVPTIHAGPSENLFKKPGTAPPSDLGAQFFVLDDELDPALGATVRSILDRHQVDYNYLG